jgi:hypothetical protein
MTTMTMPSAVERAQQRPAQGVSQLMPLLVAIVFLVATGVASVLISGPMH